MEEQQRREKMRLYMRDWRAAHREAQAAYQRMYQITHYEQISARNRARYSARRAGGETGGGQ